MKALILAGGKGTRLYPTTKVLNKHLLLVYDKPLILHAIDTIKEAGITDIVISLSHDNPEQFMELLGDGSQFGVTLTYVIHGEPKGISYGIWHARNVLGNQPFMCYLGDNIFGKSLKPYVEEFTSNPIKSLILLLRGVNEACARRYGVAKFGDAHVESRPDWVGPSLVNLVEKPEHPPSSSILLGAYFFTSKFFDIYPHLQPSNRGEYEITDAINALMPDVTYRHYEGEWFDAGTFDSILDASNYMKRKNT
jgi:glucose-1-phosphate thymidylyltransferase